jgi:hypothetical protein
LRDTPAFSLIMIIVLSCLGFLMAWRMHRPGTVFSVGVKRRAIGLDGQKLTREPAKPA